MTNVSDIYPWGGGGYKGAAALPLVVLKYTTKN